MKLPPQVIEIFLRSSGAPPALIELVRLVQAEGFAAFQFQPVHPDDPNWKAIGADADRTRNGVWLRAIGPNSRVTACFLMEGANEKTLEALTSLASNAAPAQIGA
jgi:hypothetical protein